MIFHASGDTVQDTIQCILLKDKKLNTKMLIWIKKSGYGDHVTVKASYNSFLLSVCLFINISECVENLDILKTQLCTVVSQVNFICISFSTIYNNR